MSAPISLNLEEKCYLVALFGDVPEKQRARLFGVGQFPAQGGIAVMQAGHEFIGATRGVPVMRRPRRPRWRRQHPAL